MKQKDKAAAGRTVRRTSREVITGAVIGLILGVAIVMLQRRFRLDPKLTVTAYIAVIVLCLAFNLVYNSRYLKRANALLPFLESGKTGEFISTMESLIQKAKGQKLKDLLRLNLSAGYGRAGQHDRAIELLEDLPEKPFPKQFKMVRRMNLCASYFAVGENAKGLELYRASQECFEPFRADLPYSRNLAALDISAAAAEGDYQRARELLAHAKSTLSEDEYQTIFHELEGKVTAGQAASDE